MKKNYFNLLLIIGVVIMGLMVSCTKEGPAGPAGADGTNGTNGSDGTDGVDGNVSCLVCHTAVYMDAINASFAETKHSSGFSFGYAGTRDDCAYCHSGDGFVNYTRTGVSMAPATVTGLTCETCHDNHSSLEDGIPAPMRAVSAPGSIINNSIYEHGLGNLCATCHQARRAPDSYYGSEDATYNRTFTGDDIATYQAHGAVGPNGTMELVGDTLFVTFDVPFATHTYTNSTHAGPHHGPQANMFAADIGSVVGTPFDRDHHTDCAGCHLSLEEGGGHTFAPNIAMCNECHGDALNIEEEQAAIAARMHAIEVALEAIGAIHVSDGAAHPMYASLETDQWNAFWNYMCIAEDKADGVHNFGYAKQLLTQAESALGL